MSDDLDYLSPDFDLNSLTVPRLRSILVSHDVPYPASAKKAHLIRILEDEVIPQARKLLREREKVRRTSAGITDMSRETSITGDEDEQDNKFPPPTPSTTETRRGASRRSVRGSTVETDGGNAPATPATTRRKVTARSVGKHPRASDTETGDDLMATPVPAVGVSPRKSTARKLRRSSVIPSTEVDDMTPSVKTEPRHDSVFTDENPFQSGSPSDIASSRRTSRDGKRKSGGRLSTESPAFKNSLRARKSVTPGAVKQEDGLDAPSRDIFDFSTRLQPTKEEPEEEFEYEQDDGEMYDEHDVFTGEEFTPDEQLALESEHFAPIVQARKPAKKQSSASIMASWFVILSVLGSFGMWWRKEKIEIGYCGLGKPTWSLAETKVPEWANVLEPRCEPCPPHAFCYPDFEARCEHDFILKPHPLSLGGLIPLPPTCEPDSEKARRVKAVADKAIEELRERRAKYECGELNDDGKRITPEISEAQLKEEVGKKRRKGLSEAEFEDLWKGALGDIIEKDEIVSDSDRPSDVLLLSSTSTARLPLRCAARRYVRLALLAYRLPLSLLILVACGLAYARARVRARRSDIARVPELVATTLDRLATQAALHARGGAVEPYIPIGQLRDDVLRSELHGKRREELWQRVRRVVEGNANVRAAVREGRSGDVARCWEWIGGIGSVSTPGGAGNAVGDVGRRDSARHLLPSPLNAAAETQPATIDGNDDPATSPRQARRWDEGRPIY
ncbi:hypothetical protein PDE_08987 [Penicillium oxalicum 114-2]|uniref:LEM-like domain-containing protein n=1 Tax=Penicillium oxalicum (strain 114-2 / CGMCC 5302) TaxID=933388 RepID=S7ZTI7_PENO1|nr:hypothetical protein PDE_08987 [Penicillium oxalicum 114-2]